VPTACSVPHCGSTSRRDFTFWFCSTHWDAVGKALKREIRELGWTSGRYRDALTQAIFGGLVTREGLKSGRRVVALGRA